MLRNCVGLGHRGRYQRVFHTEHQGSIRIPRRPLLAKCKDRRARGVRDLETLDEVAVAAEQRVKRHLVQRAVRHDCETRHRSGVSVGPLRLFEKGLQRRYQLCVERGQHLTRRPFEQRHVFTREISAQVETVPLYC